MTGSVLNLARRPFVNARPVTRATWLLLVLGGLLAVANAVFVTAYLRGSEAKRGQLEELEAATARTTAESARLEEELAGMNTEALNERIAFVNRRIAERTFTWGRLFDDLSEALPRDVRIVGISPLAIAETGSRTSVRRPARSSPARAGGGAQKARQPDTYEFALTITGVARGDEQLLDFIDALFARPEFSRPDLASEESESDGLGFTATASYRPSDLPDPGAELIEVAPAEPAPEPAAPAPAAEPSGDRR